MRARADFRFGFGALRGVPALALAGMLGVAGADARAASVNFDDLASFSDAATASNGSVTLGTNLVLSQADAQATTGFDTTGWATSEPNGVLNTYAPVQTFVFSTPVSDFGVDVVGLPDGLGGYTSVLLQAYRGATLVGIDVLDTGLFGPSGLPQEHLGANGFQIDRVTLTPVTVSGEALPVFELVDETTTYFFDSVTFTPVPEPGTALLLFAGLAGLVAARRGK